MEGVGKDLRLAVDLQWLMMMMMMMIMIFLNGVYRVLEPYSLFGHGVISAEK